MAEIKRFEIKRPKTATKYVSPSLVSKNKPFYKEHDPFRKQRSSERWQTLRKMVLSSSPLCKVCGHAANEVHHVVEASKDADKFFEMENLVSLCDECHKKVHAAYRRGIGPEILFNQDVVG